ncbi:MAG: Hsp33 family molecular chaperone HslO [Lachnospiraceae bacterium]|nr:Hsp33 family molecular chaperone HslO [Lachnospiraceae bacterium]
MDDYMIRGTAADGQIRFFAAYTRKTVEFARMSHVLSPIATAALGRLLTAGAMMGSMMKSEEDRLTVKIDCAGPIKGLTVTADSEGHVKGFVVNPDVDLPSKIPGKLNVGDALDQGILSVIRDTGLKTPYVGQTILETSEIAEDLAYYFTTSEQTPSSVALGVLLNERGMVKHAGGFIFQMMPGASDETAAKLEERLEGLTSVTGALDQGKTIEELVEGLLTGFEPEILERKKVQFRCDCSREKTYAMIEALPKEEIESMIAEDHDQEAICRFCGKRYYFTVDELRSMLDRA